MIGVEDLGLDADLVVDDEPHVLTDRTLDAGVVAREPLLGHVRDLGLDSFRGAGGAEVEGSGHFAVEDHVGAVVSGLSGGCDGGVADNAQQHNGHDGKGSEQATVLESHSTSNGVCLGRVRFSIIPKSSVQSDALP